MTFPKRNLSRSPGYKGSPDAAGTFASGGPVVIPKGRMLVAYSLPGFTATLTATYRHGTPSMNSAAFPPFPGIYNSQRFSSEVFYSVQPSVADPDIYWFLVPDGHLPFDSTVTKIQGNQTILETQGTTEIINPSTSESIISGNVTLPIGTLVQFTLSISGGVATNGATLYVEIIGGTSGNAYAVVCGPAAISGSFFMPVSEKIDSSGNNGDSVTHVFGVTWQATNP